MRIAFISHEVPPDTPSGGIATYVHHAARMLVRRGHDVEVIAGSKDRVGSFEQDGYRIHRIPGTVREFPPIAGKVFAERHQAVPFDVHEGPECNAEARDAVHLVPCIPLVVKLHTLSYILLRSTIGKIGWFQIARIWLGAKRRGSLIVVFPCMIFFAYL
jgi:glycogen(starch) synthase